ncbi:MAG TPA: YncE family protein [Thermoplasmata archaeon]|nr:YncE family protein [Thermoplasmata archaeon]
MIATIPVGDNPAYPCYDPADGDIYVPAYGAVSLGGNNVSVISGATNRVVAMVGVGDDPISAVYDGSNQDVFVMNFGLSHNLTAIHGTTVVAWVGVGTAPIGGVYDPSNGYVYVSNFQSNNVSVLSGTSVIASINVGNFPTTPTYDPVNGDIYVSNSGSNNVSILKGTSLVATVAVGTNPNPGAYDSGNGHIYVPNTGSDNVSVLAGTTLVGYVPVGASSTSAPYSATYASASDLVYVPCTGSNTLTTISSTGTITNVSVGQSPRQSVYDPTTGDVYVTNLLTNNVTMFNGTTIVASIDVGTSPFSGVYDSANSETYVSDYNAHNVTVLGTNLSAYTVVFNETGLPNGTTWEAQIGPTAFFSSTPSIAFSQPNGPFNYSIWPVGGYVVNETGSARVNGADLLVNVTFRELFEIPFREAGLPVGTPWNISIGPASNESTTALLGLFEPNGTYAYAIHPIPGYSTTWTGSVTVLGVHGPVNVTFLRVTYQLEFDESGLPFGTPWAVSIGGPPISSTTSRIAFNAPNGTYSYIVEPVAGYSGDRSGTLALNGSGSVVPVVFVAVYALTFRETGLPAGTAWSVSIGAATNSSSTSTIGFLEPNGTAPFTVRPVPGYAEHDPGQYTVSGGALSVTVVFEAVFNITFRETGLPIGTMWSVSVGTLSNGSQGPTVGFVEPNGSFDYVVDPVPGFAGNGTGQLTVSGSAISRSVTFLAVYAVTFSENGLPGGTPWSISVDGTSNRSTTTDLTFLLPNGSYPYRVNAIPGFRTFWSGMLTVGGKAKSVAIPFTLDEYTVAFEESGLVGGTSWSVSLNGSNKDSSSTSLTFQEPNGTFPYSIPGVLGYSGGQTGSVTVHGAAPAQVQVNFTAGKGPQSILASIGPPEWAAIGIVLAAIVVGTVLLLRRRARSPDSTPENPEPSELSAVEEPAPAEPDSPTADPP